MADHVSVVLLVPEEHLQELWEFSSARAPYLNKPGAEFFASKAPDPDRPGKWLYFCKQRYSQELFERCCRDRNDPKLDQIPMAIRSPLFHNGQCKIVALPNHIYEPWEALWTIGVTTITRKHPKTLVERQVNLEQRVDLDDNKKLKIENATERFRRKTCKDYR